MSTAVILVAAGRGARVGGNIPKQYLPLGGGTSIRFAIEAFLGAPRVRWIVPVIHRDDRALFEDAVLGVQDARVLSPVEGCVTRALSVRKGLESLEMVGAEKVLIHDAARPFVSSRIIGEAISALDDNEGVCVALPVVDALWRADGQSAATPVQRDGLWRAQTPQGFVYQSILQAHHAHDGTGADDVAVAKSFGMNVTFILGDEQNYKITTQHDLEKAQRDVIALNLTSS